MADAIVGSDTTWTVYTKAKLSGCSFSLVPSILVDPIMSAQTIASWAESGKVVRNTLDTCVIEVVKAGTTYTYSVDMVRGVVIGFYMTGAAGTAMHQYFYGYNNGVYFLRRVSCDMYDTTIGSGGYDFFNIRVNGEPVSLIAGYARAQAPRDAVYFSQRAGVTTVVITGNQWAHVSLWDLLGRNLFSARYAPGTHTLSLDKVCRRRCPAGRFLLRVEEARTGYFSTLIVP